VAFAVLRMNIRRSSMLNNNVCARVLFTGVKLDFRMELFLGFGDHCKVYDGMDNTTQSRMIPCIALYPCSNVMGSWAFYSLKTKVGICRTQWKKMLTGPELIEKMNALDPEATVLETVGGQEDVIGQQSMEAEEKEPDQDRADEIIVPGMLGESTNAVEESVEHDNHGEDVPDLVDQEADESEDEAKDEHQGSEDKDDKEPPTLLRRSARIREGVKKPGRYVMVTEKLKGALMRKNRYKEGLEKAQMDVKFSLQGP
jgi:hypothetical protein